MTSSPTVGFLWDLFLEPSHAFWSSRMLLRCSRHIVSRNDNLAWAFSHLLELHRVYKHAIQTTPRSWKLCRSVRILNGGQCSCMTRGLPGMVRVPLVRRKFRVRSFSTRLQSSRGLRGKVTQPRQCVVPRRAWKRQRLFEWSMFHRRSLNSRGRVQCRSTFNNLSRPISQRRKWFEPIPKVTKNDPSVKRTRMTFSDCHGITIERTILLQLFPTEKRLSIEILWRSRRIAPSSGKIDQMTILLSQPFATERTVKLRKIDTCTGANFLSSRS